MCTSQSLRWTRNLVWAKTFESTTTGYTKHFVEVCKDFCLSYCSFIFSWVTTKPFPLSTEAMRFLSKAGNGPKSRHPPQPSLQFSHLENEDVGLITPQISSS